LRKIVLLFLAILFLVSCGLKDLDFERIPESATMVEKTQQGIITNVDEASLANSIKGIIIIWREAATISPEISTRLCFVYSESAEELKKLFGLRDHKVRLTYIYEDDGWMDYKGKRAYMPIARMIRVEDLGE
jgi:hypothetical protein